MIIEAYQSNLHCIDYVFLQRIVQNFWKGQPKNGCSVLLVSSPQGTLYIQSTHLAIHGFKFCYNLHALRVWAVSQHTDNGLLISTCTWEDTDNPNPNEWIAIATRYEVDHWPQIVICNLFCIWWFHLHNQSMVFKSIFIVKLGQE